MCRRDLQPVLRRHSAQHAADRMTAAQQLTEAVQAGRVPAHEAAAVLTFADFLKETPAGATNLGNSRAAFDTDEQFNAWRMRWLPYIAGLATGPTDRQRYTELLPDLRRWWENR